MNISVNIKITHLTFSLIILDIIREDILSRFFIFCLVFILCNVESIVENNVKKFPVFCHKIETRTWNKNLGHRSLFILIIDKYYKFQ